MERSRLDIAFPVYGENSKEFSDGTSGKSYNEVINMAQYDGIYGCRRGSFEFLRSFKLGSVEEGAQVRAVIGGGELDNPIAAIRHIVLLNEEVLRSSVVVTELGGGLCKFVFAIREADDDYSHIESITLRSRLVFYQKVGQRQRYEIEVNSVKKEEHDIISGAVVTSFTVEGVLIKKAPYENLQNGGLLGIEQYVFYKIKERRVIKIPFLHKRLSTGGSQLAVCKIDRGFLFSDGVNPLMHCDGERILRIAEYVFFSIASADATLNFSYLSKESNSIKITISNDRAEDIARLKGGFRAIRCFSENFEKSEIFHAFLKSVEKKEKSTVFSIVVSKKNRLSVSVDSVEHIEFGVPLKGYRYMFRAPSGHIYGVGSGSIFGKDVRERGRLYRTAVASDISEWTDEGGERIYADYSDYCSQDDLLLSGCAFAHHFLVLFFSSKVIIVRETPTEAKKIGTVVSVFDGGIIHRNLFFTFNNIVFFFSRQGLKRISLSEFVEDRPQIEEVAINLENVLQKIPNHREVKTREEADRYDGITIVQVPELGFYIIKIDDLYVYISNQRNRLFVSRWTSEKLGGRTILFNDYGTLWASNALTFYKYASGGGENFACGYSAKMHIGEWNNRLVEPQVEMAIPFDTTGLGCSFRIEVEDLELGRRINGVQCAIAAPMRQIVGTGNEPLFSNRGAVNFCRRPLSFSSSSIRIRVSFSGFSKIIVRGLRFYGDGRR